MSYRQETSSENPPLGAKNGVYDINDINDINDDRGGGGGENDIKNVMPGPAEAAAEPADYPADW